MSDSTPSYFTSVTDELPVQRAKTAIVTCAYSEIELELAKKLSLNGYRVVVNSHRITSARILAKTEHIKLVDGDISLQETAERVVATAASEDLGKSESEELGKQPETASR